MAAITPVDRSPPSAANPHLYVFDTFGYSHPAIRDPSVFSQTTCDLRYVYNSVPGGRGAPNSLGYMGSATYDGLPEDPDEDDFIENAIHAARCAAINMHYRGQHRGAGEEAVGSKSGSLYIKGFGLCKQATDIDPCPAQFALADSVSGTEPALIETNCQGASTMTLTNVPWNRFSPYNANGVARSRAWALAFCTELKRLCDAFDLHPESGVTRLCYPYAYMDDNEDYLRHTHFSIVSSVNDANKASFVDYNPAFPTLLLGQSIPGLVRRVDIRNMMFEADGVTELERFQNEKIWAVYSNGTYQEKTFKDKWTEWIARGVFTSAPLPTSLTQTQINELNQFGQEIQFWAIYRAFVQPFQEVFGYTPLLSNYQAVKGTPNFSEQFLYRQPNFGWQQQIIDCRITQGSGDTFDTAAFLAEVQRRLDQADKDLPIHATFRVRGLSDTGVTFGTWETSAKPLWEYLTRRGVYHFRWYSPDDQQDALYQAWKEFRASLDASDDATGPTVMGRRGRGRSGRGGRR